MLIQKTAQKMDFVLTKDLKPPMGNSTLVCQLKQCDSVLQASLQLGALSGVLRTFRT
jgi:hypothetical protein